MSFCNLFFFGALNQYNNFKIMISNPNESQQLNIDNANRIDYKVLFWGAEYSVLIPIVFYPNEIDVPDSCDFCVIIRNKDGFFYENVTINDIRNSLKNNDHPTQSDLLNAVRAWNEFDFFKADNAFL